MLGRDLDVVVLAILKRLATVSGPQVFFPKSVCHGDGYLDKRGRVGIGQFPPVNYGVRWAGM